MVSTSSIPSGVIGGIVAILLVSCLATRAVPAARFRDGRYVVEYRLPAKMAGWCCLAVGSFIAYAALRASADHGVLATCVGGALFLVTLHFPRDPVCPHRVRRQLHLYIFSMAEASSRAMERCRWLLLFRIQSLAHSQDARLRFHSLEHLIIWARYHE